MLKSDVVIPRTIQWKDIQLPDRWLLKAATPPKPVKSRKVEEILQYEDGDVIVKFGNNRTARLSTSSARSSISRNDPLNSVY